MLTLRKIHRSFIVNIIFSYLLTSIMALNTKSTIRFLQLADWGGIQGYPYHNPSQTQTATQMGKTAQNISAQFVIALGDNFYSYGIQGTDTNYRFEETWNAVYRANSLQIDWYICAGNHDHRGNVSAQIMHTALSNRWNFFDYYYKRTFFSEDGTVCLDLIMIDTTLYTGGVNKGNQYPSHYADKQQHQFIEHALQTSTADYILVGGHHAVYSACEHGNTVTLLNHIKPLLEKYNAHYFSGHEHCAEHITVNSIHYFLNGIGKSCCYRDTNRNLLPTNSLRYLLSNSNSKKEKNGINGTIGGFSSIIIDKTKMTVTYINQKGDVLYQTSVPSRNTNLYYYLINKLIFENNIFVNFILVVIALSSYWFLKYCIRDVMSVNIGRNPDDDVTAECDDNNN